MTSDPDAKTDDTMITMQAYHCGPYLFRAVLPRIGTNLDRRQWTASIDGQELPQRFLTLEHAMIATARRTLEGGSDVI